MESIDARVRVSVRACVRACVCACVRACVCVCLCVHIRVRARVYFQAITGTTLRSSKLTEALICGDETV